MKNTVFEQVDQQFLICLYSNNQLFWVHSLITYQRVFFLIFVTILSAIILAADGSYYAYL